MIEKELPEAKKARRRTEPPSKPDYFDQSIRLIGGMNPLNEPNLRVRWGWDCRVFRNGNPEALAYPENFLDRWILEKWIPPEFFGSRKQWEQHRYAKRGDGKQVDLLGDFPSRGRYGMVWPITDPEGRYIPLTSQVLNFIEQMQSAFNARTLNVYSDAKLYAKLQEDMLEEDARMAEAVEAEAEEFGEYVRAHEDEINQERAYSMPTESVLFKPDGSHFIN